LITAIMTHTTASSASWPDLLSVMIIPVSGMPRATETIARSRIVGRKIADLATHRA
jgi:hypothetical protein